MSKDFKISSFPISDFTKDFHSTLYHKVKGRKWSIWLEKNIMFRNDGLTFKDFVKEPSQKTISGKQNTTNIEQAIIEAKKEWIKKVQAGYCPDENDKQGCEFMTYVNDSKEKQGGNAHGITRQGKGSLKTNIDNNVVNGITVQYPVMCAPSQYFDKKLNKFIWDEDMKKEIIKKNERLLAKKSSDIKNDSINKFNNEYIDATNGVFVQPKFDGYRCIAFLHKGQVAMFTRGSGAFSTNKQFVFLSKQREEIKKFLAKNPDTVLDGELYVHQPELIKDYPEYANIKPSEFFNKVIQKNCGTALKQPGQLEHLLQYHVFDIVDCTMTQSERLKKLVSMFSNFKSYYVKPVELKIAKSEFDVYDFHDEFYEKQNYEGIMIRNPSGHYEGKRSLHLIKYKCFEDSEFTVIGAKESAEGCVLWVCQTNSGHEFTCDMILDKKTQQEMYENYTDYLGKKLTIKYQGLGENDIPRFAKGLRFRDEE